MSSRRMQRASIHNYGIPRAFVKMIAFLKVCGKRPHEILGVNEERLSFVVVVMVEASPQQNLGEIYGAAEPLDRRSLISPERSVDPRSKTRVGRIGFSGSWYFLSCELHF